LLKKITPAQILSALKGDSTQTTQNAVSLPAIQRYTARGHNLNF